MGKHILKCECGREHDIGEMFGEVVKEWLERIKKEEKDNTQSKSS